MVLMEALDHQKKKFNINFTKANTKYCLILHCNADNSYFLVNVKEIFKFKADNKSVNFSAQFLELLLVDKVESREVSLNGTVYDFSVHYNSIDKSDILNIRKHLITKNNIK